MQNTGGGVLVPFAQKKYAEKATESRFARIGSQHLHAIADFHLGKLLAHNDRLISDQAVGNKRITANFFLDDDRFGLNGSIDHNVDGLSRC
jgi:hypothetical protein